MRNTFFLSHALVAITLMGSIAYLPGCENAESSTSATGSRDGKRAGAAAGSGQEVSAKSDKKIESAKAAAQTATIQDTTFDDIKFEMKKSDPFERKMVTPEIEKLAGQRIRIRGFILPPYVRTGLDQFVLVRDNQECCFGPGAALFDCILVRMEEGKTTDYTELPVAVEGTFQIERFPPDSEERPLAIYQMIGESVK